METMLASQQQKDFFSEISSLPDLVLGVKRDEVCSVNAHGRFRLYDKHWIGHHKSETLIEFCPTSLKQPKMTETGEPLVHLHVDWRIVRFCLIEDRCLPLIGTKKEIVFAQSKSPKTRLFWFYSKNNLKLSALIKKHARTITLIPPP